MLKSIILDDNDNIMGFHFIDEEFNIEKFMMCDEILKILNSGNIVRGLDIHYDKNGWYSNECDLNKVVKYTMEDDFFDIDTNGIILGLTDIGERFVNLGCTYLVLPHFVKHIMVKELGDSCFQDSCFYSIKLPEYLIKIGKSAFMRSSISLINIPDSCEEIGESAFMECYDLEELDLGCGVRVIDLGAFYDCKGLDSGEIVIPHSVEKIGYDSFGCIEDAFFILEKRKWCIEKIFDVSNFDEDFDTDFEDNYDDFENVNNRDIDDEDIIGDEFFGAYNCNVMYLQ